MNCLPSEGKLKLRRWPRGASRRASFLLQTITNGSLTTLLLLERAWIEALEAKGSNKVSLELCAVGKVREPGEAAAGTCSLGVSLLGALGTCSSCCSQVCAETWSESKFSIPVNSQVLAHIRLGQSRPPVKVLGSESGGWGHVNVG